MDGPFAGQTDPTPYIVAVYTIGLIFLAGLPIWSLWEESRIRAIIAQLKSRDSKEI